MRSPPGAAARLALAAAAWASLAASRAGAAPLTAELAVERAPEAADCPDVAGLARIIERIVSADAGAPLVPAGGDVRAVVRFSHAAGTYQATLLFTGKREGERTLTDTGPSCTALGRAAGITMALLLDAGLDAAPATPGPAPATPPASPTIVVAAAPSAPPSAPRSAEVTLAATVGSALGVVGAPALATGVALVVDLKRRATLSLDGQYVAPRSTTFDEGEVDVGLLAARLRLCGVLNGDSSVRVGVCATGAGGQLRGEGRGYATADSARTLTWLAAGGGLEATRGVGRLRLSLAADALAPLRKSTFSIVNRGVAYQSSAVAAMVVARVGVVLW